MMQTGPVVTLQVAKLGASYHGLGALLSERSSDRLTGKDKVCLAICSLSPLSALITFSCFTR